MNPQRNDLVYIAFDPAGRWHHSTFPQPLITADYDEANRLIGIELIGPPAHVVDARIQKWIEEVLA